MNTGNDWGMTNEIASGPDERHLNPPPSGVDILRFGEIHLDIKLLYPDSKLPAYAKEGDGALDFYARSLELDANTGVTWVDLGVAVAVPKNWSLLLFSRSGDGARFRIRLANGVGVIDSGYRGPLIAALVQDHPGRRPAMRLGVPILERPVQGMLVYTPEIKLNVVQELSKTARGEGGFGSTNAKCCYNCAAGEGPCLSTI